MSNRKSSHRQTCLVTGGAGFIGSHLARRLIELGWQVVILDNLSTGLLTNVPEGALFYRCDIAQREHLFRLRIPGPVTCIFHLAAQSSGERSFDNPLHDIDTNYRATYHLLELCSRLRCRRFIYTSSMSVYGDVPRTHSPVTEDYPCHPVSYYGLHKLSSERLTQIYSRQAGIRATTFRLFSVYGPGQNMANMKQGIVSIYWTYLRQNRPVLVKGSLSRYRDLVYISDVVDLLASAPCQETLFDGVFNVGTGRRTTVRMLLKKLLEIEGKQRFWRWVRVQGHTPGDILGCFADISRVRQATNWTPRVSLDSGLRHMKQWIDTQPV